MRQYRELAVSSMLILIALISVSLVHAQPSLGTTEQSVPFESSPITHATDKIDIGQVTSPTAAYDMVLTSPPVCTVPLTGNTLGGGFPPAPPDNDVRYLEFSGFTTADPLEFYLDPEWVDIKIRYECPATTDDQYRIVYQVAPDSAWYVLQDWVSGSDAAATVNAKTIGRSFPDVAEPNDGTWDWTDVSNLVVRVETQMMSTNDAKSITIYEVWALVYSAPKPPTSSTAISIQPNVAMDIQAGETFYIEVVLMDFTPPPGLWGYQVIIKYDTSVLTATDYFTHAPWLTEGPGGIDDAAGTVGVAFYTFLGDTVGGLVENSSLCRIYFIADSGGTSDLTVSFGELKPAGIEPIYPPLYDGWVSVDRVMSYKGSLLPPGDPSAPPTEWHELYPDYCKNWTLTSWEDTQPVGEPGYGELSKCDQIDMENETGWTYWFHIDEVTVTVHWEFKEGAIDGPLTGEVGAAEPRAIGEPFNLPPWDPATSPLYTGFHQIYPVYSRPFGISNWADTDESGTLTPSDQIEILYVDVYPYEYAWAHVTDITTDILVSQKPIEPEPPPVPEFPLGLGLMIAIAPAIPIVYLWRTRKKVVR